MKELTTRQEIAQAMNFGKYPILKIDLAETDWYGLKGCKFRLDAGKFSDGENFYLHCEVRVYGDSKKLTVDQGGTMLSSTYNYSDFMEDYEYASAPLIKPDDEVAFFITDSRSKRLVRAFIAKIGNKIDKFCSTPIKFEDVDMTDCLEYAGIFDEQ